MSAQSKPAASSTPNYTIPFIIVTALFCIFGFLTNLNSNLAPKLEDIFNLNHMWSNFVTTSWFLAYLFFSVPSGKLIEWIGYKRTMVTSLFIMVIGALLFIPAAAMVSFPFFLTASFVLATGVCVLQTSANPYVSILGPEHSAPARLTLAQAFNSLGSALAPLVVGYFILTNDTKNASQTAIAHTVMGPYIAIAIALLILGFAVMFMNLPAITSGRTAEVVDPRNRLLAGVPDGDDAQDAQIIGKTHELGDILRRCGALFEVIRPHVAPTTSKTERVGRILHGDRGDRAILDPQGGKRWVPAYDHGNRGFLDKGGPSRLRHGEFFEEGLVRNYYKFPGPSGSSRRGTQGRLDDRIDLLRLHRLRAVCPYASSFFRKFVKHHFSFLQAERHGERRPCINIRLAPAGARIGLNPEASRQGRSFVRFSPMKAVRAGNRPPGSPGSKE